MSLREDCHAASGDLSVSEDVMEDAGVHKEVTNRGASALQNLVDLDSSIITKKVFGTCALTNCHIGHTQGCYHCPECNRLICGMCRLRGFYDHNEHHLLLNG